MLDNTERKDLENPHSARERYFELLNGLTRKILLSTDWNVTLQTLAFDIRDLVEADDDYVMS
jgi:hypothetical protein